MVVAGAMREPRRRIGGAWPAGRTSARARAVAPRTRKVAMTQPGHGALIGRAVSDTLQQCSESNDHRARSRALAQVERRRSGLHVSVISVMQARNRRRHESPRPFFHDRPWLRGVIGLAMGLGVSLSCGGSKGGGGGGGCPPSTGSCSQCPPGTNLYTCAIQTTNNWICVGDDFSADQHCAAIDSIVASKTPCGGGGDETATGHQQPPHSPDEGAQATGGQDGGSSGDQAGRDGKQPSRGR